MLLNCGVGEDSESSLDCKEIQPVHSEGDQPWDFRDTVDLGGAFRYSTGFGAIEEGLISNGGRTSGVLSISDSGRRVPAEYGQESHASSSVDEWISACLSSCSRSDRPLVELSVEPAGFSGRCTGVSVPLRVVPLSTC